MRACTRERAPALLPLEANMLSLLGLLSNLLLHIYKGAPTHRRGTTTAHSYKRKTIQKHCTTVDYSLVRNPWCGRLSTLYPCPVLSNGIEPPPRIVAYKRSQAATLQIKTDTKKCKRKCTGSRLQDRSATLLPLQTCSAKLAPFLSSS